MDVQIQGYPGNLVLQKCTIPNGAAVSEMISTQGMALVGIFTPTSGWTAAAIGFKTCWDGSPASLVAAYNNGGTLEQCLVSTDAAAASIGILFPSPDALFVPYIALTSVTAASTTGVNQAAERVIYLLFRRYLS